MTSSAPEASKSDGPAPQTVTLSHQTAMARLVLLGELDQSEPGSVISHGPWHKGMVPKKTPLQYQVARYIYLRMGAPRTIARLREGAAFLGFGRPLQSTLRAWRAHGGWSEEAIAYDIGVMSIREMKERLSQARRGMVISVMDAITETIALALDVETMERAIQNAAQKGDFKGIVEGAKSLIAEMNALAGESVTSSPIIQHQHVHAHVPGQPGAPGAPVPAGTAVDRVLGLLDNAAEMKRVQKPATEGPLGPTIDITATKERPDERKAGSAERKPGRVAFT